MTAHVALAVRPKSAKSTMSSRIPRPLPLEGVVPDEGGGWTTTAVSRDLDEDCQFLQASPVPKSHGQSQGHFHPAKAKRSLIFEPSPNYHHYYDILDDALRDAAAAGKRERSSEEEETTASEQRLARMKQVKKRVKRIDNQKQNNPESVRRSREIQDLLKTRNPNYQRPKRGDEATESLAASTPCVMKAKKTYRRPHANRKGLLNESSGLMELSQFSDSLSSHFS